MHKSSKISQFSLAFSKRNEKVWVIKSNDVFQLVACGVRIYIRLGDKSIL